VSGFLIFVSIFYFILLIFIFIFFISDRFIFEGSEQDVQHVFLSIGNNVQQNNIILISVQGVFRIRTYLRPITNYH
jgi:hypothetical protein